MHWTGSSKGGRTACLVIAASMLVACQNNTIDVITGEDAESGELTTTGLDTGRPVPTLPDTSADGTAGPRPTSTSTTSPMTATATATVTATDGTVEPDPFPLLLAIDSAIAPGLPFQAFATVERKPGSISIEMQWLSLDVGSTVWPRDPVGPMMYYPDIPVADDGSFTWELGKLAIPGEANPITGSDVILVAEALVVQQGMPFCGRVGGMVLSPIQVSLDGSTMAMTEVPGISALPEEFPVSCPPP